MPECVYFSQENQLSPSIKKNTVIVFFKAVILQLILQVEDLTPCYTLTITVV